MHLTTCQFVTGVLDIPAKHVQNLQRRGQQLDAILKITDLFGQYNLHLQPLNTPTVVMF